MENVLKEFRRVNRLLASDRGVAVIAVKDRQLFVPYLIRPTALSRLLRTISDSLAVIRQVERRDSHLQNTESCEISGRPLVP